MQRQHLQNYSRQCLQYDTTTDLVNAAVEPLMSYLKEN